MKLKEDQNRIKELLKDTITLLCKNGLHYKGGFCVEALIGITLDEEDVFLVNIKETVRNENAKSDSTGVDVTVHRRKTTDGSESEHESTPHKKDSHMSRSRKRPPDGSPPPHFDQPSPAKQSRLHSEPDSDASSTHYPSEQSKDSTFNIKAEPEDDELVFVKEEGVSEFSSCAQSNQGPFPLGTFRSVSQPGTPGHIQPVTQGHMINPNFSFDSSQTGTTAAESLPGMSSWASSQPGALDASGQPNISAMSAQGSQQTLGSSVNPPTTQFTCPLCSLHLWDKAHLDGHLFSKHGQGSPIRSPCGKGFIWKASYYKHKKRCEACVKAEADQQIL